MSAYDEHGNYTIPKHEIPAVVEDGGPHVIVPVTETCTGRIFAGEKPSGELRRIGHAYIALAEHRYWEEHREVEELDRIAIDIFAVPWVSLKPEARNAVTAVHQRYTRNDDIPEIDRAAWKENPLI